VLVLFFLNPTFSHYNHHSKPAENIHYHTASTCHLRLHIGTITLSDAVTLGGAYDGSRACQEVFRVTLFVAVGSRLAAVSGA